MNLRPQRPEPPDINLAPLIDVVFLLLIFFMVTTTFREEVGIKIQLPQAQGEAAAEQQALTLVIDASGDFYVNDRRVADTQPDSLRKALGEAIGQIEPEADDRAPGEMPLVLMADAKTPHQAVMTALDVASQLGLTRFSFAASRAQEAP
ncbi:MAG: biopolymer transporter ExbD [Chromatiaceae bacterium]|nr:biopolymer transporter ExbD [Chromatiaceae bacterium]MBP8288505.1 biopolymer transporter ExbD [Chromatiaceae bacterium]